MTTRVWVTGYEGFMGPHLVDLLHSGGDEVLGSYYAPVDQQRHAETPARLEKCDVRDSNRVASLLADFKPDKIFHLAAQSYPTVSWQDPHYTIEANVIGTINIFEAVKKQNLDCIILNACSSAGYGYVTEDEVPITEEHALRPLHPYGVSKVAQEMLGYQYHRNFGIKSIAARIFNTTGPGKVNDVCSDLSRRLIDIEQQREGPRVLKVGNLETKRAITDVRDVIRAFDLALDKATVGEAYNLSGDTVYSIRAIVELLRELVGFDFTLEQDPALLRSTDEPIIFGSSEKFRQVTGWSPTIPLRDTLADMLTFWRERR